MNDATTCPDCGSARTGPEAPCTVCGWGHAGSEPYDGWREVRRQLEDAVQGEFEILGELGRGGMATVYRGRDIALGRNVAIKVMAPGLLMGPGMVERFRQEAVTVANLHHPNIVTIHTVRQVGSLHFFVMGLVEGDSLESVLRRSGALPIPLAQAILYQVGTGLASAHRRGVVHRDIKPANVLLDRDGSAILTDFGIAKVTTAGHLTQTGLTIGTPNYMSPEQCLAGEITAASDQYSLGVVAWELLVGSPPFTGAPFEVMQAHSRQPPPPIRDRRPEVPEELEAAVLRMLAKEPEDRFPSMAEAIEAIGGYIPGPRDPLRAELVRLVDPDATGARAAAGPTPLSPLPSNPPHAPVHPPTTDAGDAGRPRQILPMAGALGLVALVVVGGILALRGRGGEEPFAEAPAVAAGGPVGPEGGGGAAPEREPEGPASEAPPPVGGEAASPSPSAPTAPPPPGGEPSPPAPAAATPSPAPRRVQSVRVLPPSGILEAGGRAVLRAVVAATPEDWRGTDGVRWESSDPGVVVPDLAEGDSVVARLVGPGEVTLTARADGVEGSVALSVRAPLPVVTLALSQPSVNFQAVEQGPPPAEQSVRITITGGVPPFLGVVRYDGTGRDWLRTNLGGGADGQAVLTVRAEPGGLAPGTYRATLPVEAGGLTRELGVQLVVTPRPVATTVEPSPQAEQEIGQMLQAYASAINARDEARVRELYPSIPAEAIRDMRDARPGYLFQVNPLPGTLRRGAREGTLDMDVSSGIVPPTGAGQTRRMVFTVGRGGGGAWQILGIRTAG